MWAIPMAKMHGDVTPEQRALLAGLEEYEAWMNEREDALPPEAQAKMCVALAHDWYDLGLDEEGNRLLNRAEAAFPGYFKGPIYDHMLQDSDYYRVVKQLQAVIATDILNALGIK